MQVDVMEACLPRALLEHYAAERDRLQERLERAYLGQTDPNFRVDRRKRRLVGVEAHAKQCDPWRNYTVWQQSLKKPRGQMSKAQQEQYDLSLRSGASCFYTAVAWVNRDRPGPGMYRKLSAGRDPAAGITEIEAVEILKGCGLECAVYVWDFATGAQAPRFSRWGGTAKSGIAHVLFNDRGEWAPHWLPVTNVKEEGQVMTAAQATLLRVNLPHPVRTWVWDPAEEDDDDSSQGAPGDVALEPEGDRRVEEPAGQHPTGAPGARFCARRNPCPKAATPQEVEQLELVVRREPCPEPGRPVEVDPTDVDSDVRGWEIVQCSEPSDFLHALVRPRWGYLSVVGTGVGAPAAGVKPRGRPRAGGQSWLWGPIVERQEPDAAFEELLFEEWEMRNYLDAVEFVTRLGVVAWFYEEKRAVQAILPVYTCALGRDAPPVPKWCADVHWGIPLWDKKRLPKWYGGKTSESPHWTTQDRNPAACFPHEAVTLQQRFMASMQGREARCLVELRDELLRGLTVDVGYELYVQMRGVNPLDSTRLVGGCVAPAVAEKLVCLEGNLLIKHRCFRTMADGRRYQILGLEEERLPSLMDKVENVLDLATGYRHRRRYTVVRIARSVDGTEVDATELRSFPDESTKARFLKSVVRQRLPEHLVGPFSDTATAILATDRPELCPMPAVAREMIAVDRAMTAACGAGIMAFSQPN
jgi:hypothetical protein